MRTRRVKQTDILEDLRARLFELMYADDANSFWLECVRANCANSGLCAERNCNRPHDCARFQFVDGHRFARFNPVLHEDIEKEDKYAN